MAQACVDIGHVRVYTTSVLTAARVAAKVKTLGGSGTIDGVKWEGLGKARLSARRAR